MYSRFSTGGGGGGAVEVEARGVRGVRVEVEEDVPFAGAFSAFSSLSKSALAAAVGWRAMAFLANRMAPEVLPSD